MIVVTGGAGFIGSAFCWKLNREGIDDIGIVDALGTADKWKNLVNRRFADYFHKSAFREWIREDRVPFAVEGIVHLGACSSTTERDADYLMDNNTRYSRDLARWALAHDVPFLYASSAATYGDGARGFDDADAVSSTLRPINMYGYSKQLFDLWVLRHGYEKKLTGIKFFNVFGPNEYHKGDMKSVVFKAFHQVRETGRVRLFKSYRDDYGDGEQKRDFIYVKDCVEVLWWLLGHREVKGLFNLGTSRARSWNDLAGAVFAAMGRERHIEYVEMPPGLRDQYQYFTEARMDKLLAAGCPFSPAPLEETVADYVDYLSRPDPCLERS